jgi:hypothetical protein
MTEPSQQPSPAVPLPAPGPRVRPSDPPLAPLPASLPELQPTRPRRLVNPFAQSGQRTDDTTDTRPPDTGSTSGERRRRWRWEASGNPDDVADVLAGLFVLAVGGLAAAVARGGRRRLRKPTERQADDIGAPLAAIACRHLPMGLLGKDLKDLGLFAGALQAYVEGGPDDGPLLTRTTDRPTGVTS